MRARSAPVGAALAVLVFAAASGCGGRPQPHQVDGGVDGLGSAMITCHQALQFDLFDKLHPVPSGNFVCNLSFDAYASLLDCACTSHCADVCGGAGDFCGGMPETSACTDCLGSTCGDLWNTCNEDMGCSAP